MIVVYSKMTKKQLKKIVEDSIKKIGEWFKSNPKRKICKVEWVYSEEKKVRRNHVEEDIKKLADETETSD